MLLFICILLPNTQLMVYKCPIRYIGTLLLVLLFISSCEKDKTHVPERSPITFDSDVSEPSRLAVSTYGPITLARLKASTDGFAVSTNGLGSGGEMAGLAVKYNSTASAWQYTGNYYWPISPSQNVAFTAYAPAGLSGASLTSSGLILTNYIAPNNTNSQVDILYAPPTNYTRSGGNVSLNFRHILTQIIFSVTTDIPSTSTPKIVSIQLCVNNGQGSFNGSTWSPSTYVSCYTVFNSNTISSTPVTSVPIFVIPQTIPGGTNAKVTVSTKKGTYFKVIDLSSLSTVKAWNQNTLVTYNVFISKGSVAYSAKETVRID